VPNRIVVAFFAELTVYRIWADIGLFAELLGILEEALATERERWKPAVISPWWSQARWRFLRLAEAEPGRILCALSQPFPGICDAKVRFAEL
jgi:hypothetical protein